MTAAERKAMKDAFIAGYDAGAYRRPRECPYLVCKAFAPIIDEWLRGYDAGRADLLRCEARLIESAREVAKDCEITRRLRALTRRDWIM